MNKNLRQKLIAAALVIQAMTSLVFMPTQAGAVQRNAKIKPQERPAFVANEVIIKFKQPSPSIKKCA
ncbi:MAG TPA: hypothetical protein VHS59_04110 [Bacillota bacterium]|nr:hypothetical protein [Bacillota bacterium]